MRALAQQGFARLTDAMETAASVREDPLAAFNAAGVAYVDFARQNTGHFRVMFDNALVDIHSNATPIPEGDAAYAVLTRLATQAVEAGHGRSLSPKKLP